jgi:hypothetical protein
MQEGKELVERLGKKKKTRPFRNRKRTIAIECGGIDSENSLSAAEDVNRLGAKVKNINNLTEGQLELGPTFCPVELDIDRAR